MVKIIGHEFVRCMNDIPNDVRSLPKIGRSNDYICSWQDEKTMTIYSYCEGDFITEKFECIEGFHTGIERHEQHNATQV